MLSSMDYPSFFSLYRFLPEKFKVVCSFFPPFLFFFSLTKRHLQSPTILPPLTFQTFDLRNSPLFPISSGASDLEYGWKRTFPPVSFLHSRRVPHFPHRPKWVVNPFPSLGSRTLQRRWRSFSLFLLILGGTSANQRVRVFLFPSSPPPFSFSFPRC